MTPAIRALAVTILLAACEHAQPYEVNNVVPPNPPLAIGSLQQLTVSDVGDFAPAWTTGDSIFTYSHLDETQTDGDRCVAYYVVAESRIRRFLCYNHDLLHDTTNMVRATATSPGGRLAFVQQVSPPGQPLSHGALYVYTPGDTAPVPVLGIPYSTSGNVPVTDVEQIAWLNEHTLVFVGTQLRGTQADMQSYTVILDVLDVGAAQPVLTEVPNSARATSVAVDPADGAAYATFAGDSLVYAIDLATGQRTAMRNFVAYGTPRDIKVAQHRVAAVVLGRIDTIVGSGVDSVDQGGNLIYASLTDTLPPVLLQLTGVSSTPSGPNDSYDRWFRHLALSDNGKLLVAEGYPVTYHKACPLCPPDTTVTKVSDLFLARLP